MSAVHEAYLQLIEDDQGGNGDVPTKVPNDSDDRCHDVAWTSAYPIITNFQHQYYGNKRIVERRWPSLVRFLEYLIGSATATEDNRTKLAVCSQ